MSEQTDGNEISTVTDDLDAFSAEFFGTAKQEEVKEEVVEEVEDTEAVETSEEEVEEVEEEAAEEEDEESEPEAEEPKKTRKTAKDRIQELANERREERDARIAAETRLKDLEEKLAKLNEPEEKAAAPQNAAKGQPDPDATDDAGELLYPLGEFDPQYIADLTKFHFRQEYEATQKENAEKAEREAAETAAAEQFKNWENKLEETEAALPDLRDKIRVLDSTFNGIEPEYGAYLADAIMQLDRGPEVLYYLANNISEAQKIVASGPVAAIIALGRLEGIMTDDRPADKRNEVKVSKAPAPPTSTRGTAVAKVIAPDTDDLEAFEAEFYGKRKR